MSFTRITLLAQFPGPLRAKRCRRTQVAGLDVRARGQAISTIRSQTPTASRRDDSADDDDVADLMATMPA
jgi:hypothetical protein